MHEPQVVGGSIPKKGELRCFCGPSMSMPRSDSGNHRMKRIAIVGVSLAIYVADSVRRVISPVFGKKMRPRFVVLAYHSVPDEHQEAFARQMRALVRGSKAARADMSIPSSGHEHYVAVTFDDGYQTILRNALPELAQRGIPCTIFVAPGALGMRPNWTDYSGGADASLNDPILSVEQLQRLSPDSVEIGSHTVTHPMLAQLPERDARMELCRSRSMLAEILGRDVKLFSFPYGSFNARLLELCRDVGYERVFITHPETVGSKESEFLISRTKADPKDWPLEFHLKLRGAYRWRNRWRRNG